MSRRWLAALLLVAAALAVRCRHLRRGRRTIRTRRRPARRREQILGADATSPTTIGTGIVGSLVAAGAIVALLRRPIVDGVAAFAAVFAMLDLAEAVHGVREGEQFIGVLALMIAALHGAAAVIAHQMAFEPASPASPVAPGNLSR